MTKAQKAEKQEAIDQLREWIKPGDTVYTILEHVSRSGMQREIRVLVPYVKRDGVCGPGNNNGLACSVDFLHPNWSVAKALGLRQGKRDGLIMGGCGMDMGFALVYELSHALYGASLHKDVYKAEASTLHKDGTGPLLTREGAPEGHVYVGGYRCLGKGRCPSNYHSNHHDTIRCPGTRVYNPDGPDTGSGCYPPWSFRDHGDHTLPDGWPMREVEHQIENEPPVMVPHALHAVHVGPEDGGQFVVCPTCDGAGRIDNPDGPERFDLVHTDGYALRHRWL